MRILIKSAFFLFISFFLIACSGKKSEEWQKSPVDQLIRDMDKVPSFSIILYDMNVEGNFTKTYQHQYKIITLVDSVPSERITEWYTVSQSLFTQHEEHMGMEIAAKTDDGKITKTAAPPGYSNYVGNERYGHWVQDGNGGSFWEFYGKYMFFSSMFNMIAYPAYRNNFMDYRSNYYGSRPYYGSTSSGNRIYGTNSDYSRKANAGSRWNSNLNRNSFKSGNSGNKSGNSFFGGSDRTTRSGSRYNSGFSSRSRSGGFGK